MNARMSFLPGAFRMRTLLAATCMLATLPALAQHHHPATTNAPPAAEHPDDTPHHSPKHGAHRAAANAAHTDPSAADAMPRTPIPPLTDADRAAATRPLHVAHEHDDAPHSLVVFNRLETWNADAGAGQRWEAKAWFGGDTRRLWLRSEGERLEGRLEATDIELLYGRSVDPWWDVVAGVRHDPNPGRAQSFAAIGVQGLAPQKFEVAATAYVGTQGQTAARLEVERDLPLSARWILQPMLEVNLHAGGHRANDADGASIETALRLRYEVTRRFAPYVGVVREQRLGEDGASNDAATRDATTRWVAGVRIWF